MSAHGDSSVHVEKVSVYLAIFGALMVLTAVTAWVAFHDYGQALNDIIALSIAVTKASLVVLYFMHVRHSTKVVKMVVASGVFWLLILFAFTLSDFLTRGPQGGIFG
jgi:cytochrome c oxidase subunit 4